MSNKQHQSPRSSQRSSPVPIQLTKSFLVSKVDTSDEFTEERLFNDFRKQSAGIIKVTRLYDCDREPINQVRVDCQSIDVVKKIMEKNYILVAGKQHPVRVYYPLICHRCRDEGHRAVDCPQQPITEQRLQEVLHEHQQNMREMISTFENRWNQRLQSMAQVKPVQNDQVTAICRELSQLCQVLQQQAAHIQTPLSNVRNRLRTLESQNVH